MTVVQPNSISGINSITVAANDSLSIHKSDGSLLREIVSNTGVSTFYSVDISKGSADLTVGISTFVVDNSAGKIGIGTVPARTFQVFAATPQVNLKSAAGGNCELQFGDTGDEVRANIIYNSTSNYLGFNGYNNTERMRIESGGRVNIVGICSATGGVHIGAAATIFANGNTAFSGISTFAGVSLSGTSESSILTQAASGGGTTDIEFETADNFIITMGGNTSITAGNQKVGQTGSIFMVQDGTGSRTASWHADFKWTGGTAPTLTTTASAIDRIDYFVKASNQIHAVASLDVK